ncbi:MAG: transposase [Acidobacteriota bacterium]
MENSTPLSKRQFTPAFKFKVALEAIKEVDSLGQLASKYGVHPTQIRKWKERLLSAAPTLFEKYQGSELAEKDELIEQLYKKIGQREIELDWLKKKMESVGS